MTERVVNAETTDSRWKVVFRVGGVAALIVVAFIPIQIIVFVIWPPPNTVVGWFNLFQKSSLIGLVDMDLLLIVDQVLMGMVLLALYAALKQVSESLMAISLILALLGIASYFASSAAFEMLSLSHQYAAATTEAQRSVYLAAGQAMLAVWQGTAFDLGYILEGLSLLIIGFVMLRSKIFSRATASIGIIVGVMSLVPPTVGTIGLFFAFGSLVPLVAWNILVGLRLLRLARN